MSSVEAQSLPTADLALLFDTCSVLFIYLLLFFFQEKIKNYKEGCEGAPPAHGAHGVFGSEPRGVR